MTLDQDQRAYFLNLFREARAAAQRDAEGFQSILFALETFGATLCQPVGGDAANLNAYRTSIAAVVKEGNLDKALRSGWHIDFQSLYEIVRIYRNDALHQGAVARNLAAHATSLSLIIEEALMNKLNRAKHVMVRNVIKAEGWYPVNIVRQLMLENSFSYIPFFDKSWYLIADYKIVEFIYSASDRMKAYSSKISDIHRDDKSFLIETETCEPEATIAGLRDKFTDRPIIVAGKGTPSQMYGLITAFDLL